LPEEVYYSSIDDLLPKLRTLAERASECRIKKSNDAVKLKLRTRRRLYTAVLTREKAGASSVDELFEKAKELAEKAGCKSVAVI